MNERDTTDDTISRLPREIKYVSPDAVSPAESDNAITNKKQDISNFCVEQVK